MDSCLYETTVMHCRFRPKRYQFTHKVFMFYLNLDEVPFLVKKLRLMGYNQNRVYNLMDKDHIDLGGATIKDNLLKFLEEKGVKEKIYKVLLMTNLRTFGHIFNPVSFFYCFDKEDHPVCVVPEIGNTFRELKPFYLGKDKLKQNRFQGRESKYYYISPFIELDSAMDFQLNVPGDTVSMQIDDYDKEGKVLVASMQGKRVELTDGNLFKYTLRFPLITLKVISLIHLHAMILYFKKVPVFRKKWNPDLQKGVFRPFRK